MIARNSKLYLSGPMTGLPQQNYPAFHAAAARLRGEGYRVVNPAELRPHGPLRRLYAWFCWCFGVRGELSPTWEDYMRAALVGLLGCEVVVVLPGWEQSRGARCEVSLAAELGMRRCTVEEVLANTTMSNGSAAKKS